MFKPKVSICIPTFNQPGFLSIVLNSIIIQEFKDYEVIISDDSTNNESELLVKQYRDKIPKLTYLKNNPSKGSPKSWNKAIRNANGEYIKVMHSDDWFSKPDSLGQFVRTIDSDNTCDFAFSSAYVCDANQKVKFVHKISGSKLRKLKLSPAYLFGRNIIGAPSATIYRNSVINKYYDEKMKWVVDIDQYIRLIQENNNFKYIPDPIVCTTDGASHQSSHSSVGLAGVELYEWMCLYSKLQKKYTNIKYKYYILIYIMFILEKCNISNISQIEHIRLDDNEKEIIKRLLMFKILFVAFKIRRYFINIIKSILLKLR